MTEKNNNLLVSVGIFASSLLIYALNPDYLLNGDAVYYANFILHGQFDKLTLHNGYYAIGFIAFNILNLFTNVELDRLLVHLNMIFGALGLVAAYWLSLDFLKSEKLSLACVMVLLFCGRYFVNATSAEIYIQQVFFILFSFHMFMVRRFVLSGFTAVAALFITPLSVFAFLFYPAIYIVRGYAVKDLVKFITPVAILYSVFLIINYEELLFGLRGLLKISSMNEFEPQVAVYKFFIYQFKHYSTVTLLALAGCFTLHKNKELLLTTFAVAVPHFYLISKLKDEDNVFIIPTDFFFAILVVLGFVTLSRRKPLLIMAILLIIANVSTQIYSLSLFDFDDNAGYRQDLNLIYRNYQKDRNAIVITGWSQRMALSYYNKDESNILESGEAYEKSFDEDELDTDSMQAMMDTDQIYVLENYEEGKITKLLLSRETRELRYRQHSLRVKVEKILNTRCDVIYSSVAEFFSCQFDQTDI